MLNLHKILAQWQVPDKYYLLKLENLLQQNGDLSPHKLFANVSDDFWLWLNTEGYRQSSQLQQILPGLPEEQNTPELQWDFG
jgi:hypothetical protein